MPYVGLKGNPVKIGGGPAAVTLAVPFIGAERGCMNLPLSPSGDGKVAFTKGSQKTCLIG